MATARTVRTTAATQAARLRQQQAAQLAQLRAQAAATPTPSSATGMVVSPYDGSSSMPMMGGAVPTLTGLDGSSPRPQLNATNQTAIAPNGTVNQTVTNENQYVNRYVNIIMPNTGLFGGLLGGIGGIGGLGGIGSGVGGWGGIGGIGGSGTSFVDPRTGVLYVQQPTGFSGWLRRLLGIG